MSEIIFAASAQMLMAGFGFHNAHVEGGFDFKTLEAMALGIGFRGLVAARRAVNIARPFQFNFLTQYQRRIDGFLVKNKLVLHLGWRAYIGIAGQRHQSRVHLMTNTLILHNQLFTG